MFRTLLLCTILVANLANAFMPLPIHQTKTQASPTKMMAGFTSEELEAIIMKGRECEKGECSISDVDMLIGDLMEHQHILSERVKEIDNMVKSLEILNDADDREVDEVRETVRAIFRVFQMSAKTHVDFNPAGFSGDVGSGPTDAYKALNPKPWKPSSSP